MYPDPFVAKAVEVYQKSPIAAWSVFNDQCNVNRNASNQKIISA